MVKSFIKEQCESPKVAAFPITMSDKQPSTLISSTRSWTSSGRHSTAGSSTLRLCKKFQIR